MTDTVDANAGGDDLAERLRAVAEEPRIVALPDGALDRDCRVYAGAGEWVSSRARFGAIVADRGRKSLRIKPLSEGPGGQSVNLARQAGELGADAFVYGHLDGLDIGDLPLTAVSMGSPARVDVCRFSDGDLLLAEESADIRSWTLADLRAATQGLDRVADADAICWLNWVSFLNTPAAVESFVASTDPTGTPWFVVDPGDVVGSDVETFRRFRDVLATVADRFRLVVTTNRAETQAFASAVRPDWDASVTTEGATPSDEQTDRAAVVALREELDATAVVLHAPERAAAATTEDVFVADNPALAIRTRGAGGGDRFGGALTYGLAVGLDWPEALELGNRAATHYIATGRTAGIDDIARVRVDPADSNGAGAG